MNVTPSWWYVEPDDVERDAMEAIVEEIVSDPEWMEELEAKAEDEEHLDMLIDEEAERVRKEQKEQMLGI